MQIEFADGSGSSIERLAPAIVGLDQIADRKARIIGGDHFANRAARQGLADLERRCVALHVVHASTHVGVDGHPGVADLNLAWAGRGQIYADQVEVVGGRQADGAALQANLA